MTAAAGRRSALSRLAGTLVLATAALVGLAAPYIAPHLPGEQFADYVNAPPMRLHIIDTDGRWRTPFVYRLRLVDRLESRYEEDRSRPLPIAFGGSRLVSLPEQAGPLLLLGADPLGRDVFSRLVLGARASLGVAVVGTLGALLLGALIGGLAGYAGGIVDDGCMQVADFVLVLPTIYVVLALRAVLPLVLDNRDLFVLMVTILAVAGWPYAARGVRTIVASEREQEYAVAARSLGAGHGRLLFRHLLPAARGFLGVQATLLLPAFILAEITLSYVGLGFAEPTPSWGRMLQEAGTPRVFASFPWLLSPAAAIVSIVLAIHMLGPGQRSIVWLARTSLGTE